MEEPESMAIQLRSIMLSFRVRVRILFLMSMLIISTGTTCAEVLSPPTKIPFAKDVVIKRYAQGQPLKLFRYTGKWVTKNVGKKLSLVGTSDETQIYLISLDKLTKEPKSFKLDFKVKDKNKEYGFIYGNIGVIIKINKMYPAVFDNKANMLIMSSANGSIIEQGISDKNNTLEINTGYDPTGGDTQSCVIYVNGTGLTFDYYNTDDPFGVYINPENSIIINNIRWGIGST